MIRPQNMNCWHEKTEKQQKQSSDWFMWQLLNQYIQIMPHGIIVENDISIQIINNAESRCTTICSLSRVSLSYSVRTPLLSVPLCLSSRCTNKEQNWWRQWRGNLLNSFQTSLLRSVRKFVVCSLSNLSLHICLNQSCSHVLLRSLKHTVEV